MKTKLRADARVWLATLALVVGCEQIRAADFHVSTAQGLQNALTLAAQNGANNSIYLTNGLYDGNFRFNSSNVNNLTLSVEPGVTNTAVTIDGGGVGAGLSIPVPQSTPKPMPCTVTLLLFAELEMLKPAPTPPPSMVTAVFVTPGSTDNVRLLTLELLKRKLPSYKPLVR